MRLRYFIDRPQIAAGLIVLGCVGAACIVTGAEPTAEPAETTETSSSLQSADYLRTDLSSISRKAPEKPLSFDSLFQRSGPVINLPPPQLNVPNRQTRELLDEHRNWVFVTPEDAIQNFMARQSPRLPEYGPDGQPKDLSVVERYYERLSRGRGITNGLPGRSQSSYGSSDDSPDPNPFAQLSDIPSLRSIFTGMNFDKSSKWSSRPNTLSDVFGTVDKSAADTINELRERQRSERHLDAFRQALDFGSPPVVADGLPNLFAPAPKPAVPQPVAVPSAQLPSYATLQGGYDPAAIMNLPSAPVAPTAPISPGQQVPSPYSHYTPTPTPTMPAKQEFTIPQRRF
jgi:hypothetical protein